MTLAIGSLMALVQAYGSTRLLQRTLKSRARIDRWQAWRLAALRRYAVANTRFYGRYREAAFPIVSKTEVMSAFQDFNVLALTSADAWRMIDRGEAPAGFELGCSTGTSGNRGLFLISERERFMWLGTILAKAIPDALLSRQRVAVILPRRSHLYEAANESGRVTLGSFPLVDGLDSVARGVSAFDPTVVVGPPKALRFMAERGVYMRPTRIFSCAEVLDPADQAIIEGVYGVQLGQIYMATEGLFGVTCAHNTLHLAEDIVHFELEAVQGSSDLVSPVVTDFTRRTQIMARYRMNDMLRLASQPCACGSALQAVAEIVGRCDDCFELTARQGAPRTVVITPDVLRNAVVQSDRVINDFRLRQTGAGTIELTLEPSVSDEVGHRAIRALEEACARLHADPEILLRRRAISPDPMLKLRRVERSWNPSRSDVSL